MLNDQTAIVTGGSRGIGRAICLELAAQGANSALVYAGNTQAAEETAEACRALGVKAGCYQCDVADFDAVKETVAKIKADFGGVQILVNNAGVTRDGLLAAMKKADFDLVIDTNLKGAFHFIRHVTPIMMRARYGRIVNISSVSGIMGNAGQSNYSASKAGVIGLTKATARELAARNVTCNAVAPGFIATDMTKALVEQNSDAITASIPLGRVGAPEDVAKAVSFLVSPDSTYITGEVLRVDGGMAM